jgi:hypothetical protein
MDVTNNKWLRVNPKVKLTPSITPVIVGLDKYFEEAKLKAVVTSGLRDANDQLRVIRQYLTIKGLDKKYPHAMIGNVDDFANDEYIWQMAWSHLLFVGVIINPPLKAKCLLDYKNKSGVNLKGYTFNQTLHASGTAFNIGGGGNGIADELAVLEKASKDKTLGIVSFLAERENNALHINCKKK